MKQNPFDFTSMFDQEGAEFQRPGVDFADFKASLAQLSRKALVVIVVAIVIIAAFCYWWFHPAINIHSEDLWEFVCLFVLLPAFVVFFAFRQIYATGIGKREKSPGKEKLFRGLMVVPLLVAALGLVGLLMSQSFFPGNAQKYASILKTTDGNFSEDVEQIDYSTIPFIDRDSAMLLGNRAMGTMADYVSQFEISSLYSQINYKGAPVRVSPLNYADVFKWWTNQSSGIPGYVIVNMNTQDTEVVRTSEPIRYSDSDPLFNNVDRHVQLHYPTYMFDEKSFEIDEDGNPYWVYPVQDRTIGLFGGTTIKRVVLCNACTGECQDFAIEDVPEWIDRAYPSDLLVQQYNWYGAYSNGWINSWLGQEGVRQTTPGSNGQAGYNYIAQGDDVWLYTGVTSATADNSVIGFVLINQRTAESHFYAVAGATEASAMSSAEGQVQNLKYDATFPLLLNINGQPTYFMALKDDAGLVKKYAMIDIQRYQNVAVGDSLSATQKSYEALLKANGVGKKSSSGGNGASEASTVAKGTIKSISPVVVDGLSHYYLILKGDDTIYDCPIDTVVDVVRYSVGDKVTLSLSSDVSSPRTVESIASK